MRFAIHKLCNFTFLCRRRTYKHATDTCRYLFVGYLCRYEEVSKILQTGAAIYTAVEVARSTGPNRSNCEFRVLLRHFAAIA
jgi:hypothetical protein